MANPYTADALLLPALKRRGMIPATAETLADTDFYALADDEIQSYIVPWLLKAREEYMVATSDISVTSGTDTYRIPVRSAGGKVRAVWISDTSVGYRQLARLEPERIGDYAQGTGGPVGYRFEGNNMVLMPSPSSNFTLRVKYHMVPNRIVATSSAGLITNVNTGAKQVTISSTPSGWGTSAADYDFVKGTPGFECAAIDQSATRSSTTLTFTASLPSGLAVGDYVTLAGETPIPQIPYSLHSLLAHRVVYRALEALGDPRMNEVHKACDELRDNALSLISPRSDGSVRPVINYNGPGFRRRFYGKWRF